VTPDTVLLSLDGPVAVVSLNRPDRHNAFNDEMDARFFEVIAELHDRDDIRAIVWRGEGRSFSSGRDTKELGKRAAGQSDLEFIQAGHDRTRLLFTMPAPVIVALKGWVLGGSFERALLCDIRIAGEDARMSLPETAHGVIPDSGGVARLFQMAGHGVASELALTGRVIDADEALRHGIVSRVVPADELDDAALELAHDIAKRPPLAVTMARRVISQLATAEVDRSMYEEMLAQTVVMGSDEYKRRRRSRLGDDSAP
jgi:enoyl-CoA hydratase/carnithine racemase